MCDVPKSQAWVKDILKVQDRQVHPNVIEYDKFDAMILDSTVQLAFNTLPFIKSLYSCKE